MVAGPQIPQYFISSPIIILYMIWNSEGFLFWNILDNSFEHCTQTIALQITLDSVPINF